MTTTHYWALTIVFFLVLMGAYGVVRRFWPRQAEQVTQDENVAERRRLAHQEKAFSRFDPNIVLCTVKGCREPATHPLLMVVARKDLFGEKGRLHGRIPRLKVEKRRDENNDPINGYCQACGAQAREHYEAVINEARSEAVRANTRIFDRIAAMNRGGVDQEIIAAAADSQENEPSDFSLPQLTQE